MMQNNPRHREYWLEYLSSQLWILRLSILLCLGQLMASSDRPFTLSCGATHFYIFSHIIPIHNVYLME
jgi:hypothetical protein